MKKFIAATALVLGFVGMNAQTTNNLKETKEPTLEIIPKVGINFANQAVKSVNGEKMKFGIQGGVGLNIHTKIDGFSIQPEVNYVGKGTKIGGEKYNLNYLEVPVLAKYSFGPVYVNAGPSVGLLMGKNNDVKAEYGSLKKIDFGVQAGLGVALPAGPGKIIIDGRYNLGLSNISDVKSQSIKNRGIYASIGYAIPL